MSRFEISKKLVAINSASTVIKGVITMTVVVWIQSYLINAVRHEEYKVLALVYPLALFVPIITMTVGGGLSRYVIDAYARGDMRKVTQITSTMFPFSLLAGALVALVGAFLTYHIQAILNLQPAYTRDAQIMFALIVWRASQRTCILPFVVGIEVKQKFAQMNAFELCLELIRVAMVVGLIFGVSARVLWMVVATVPGFIIGDIVLFLYSRSLVPELRFQASEFRRELIRPLMSFGGLTLVSRLAGIVREQSGPFLLTHFADSVQVNAHRFGSYVETKFYPFVLGPMLALQPALTGMNATGQEDRMQRTYLRMSRSLLWVFLFFGIPMSLFHREIWQVWLRDRAAGLSDGGVVFVLLFAKALFVFPQPIIAQLALAKARNGPLALRQVGLELSAVAIAAYLVYFEGMGAIGVALATFCVAAVGHPLLYWTFGLKLTNTPFARFFHETLTPGLAPALFATPVWVAAYLLMPQVSLLWLALMPLPGCAVYAFVLLRFCLRPEERADLAKAMRFGRKGK